MDLKTSLPHSNLYLGFVVFFIAVLLAASSVTLVMFSAYVINSAMKIPVTDTTAILAVVASPRSTYTPEPSATIVLAGPTTTEMIEPSSTQEMEPTAIEIFEPTRTGTLIPTQTETFKPLPTIDPTEQARPMVGVIEQLESEGVVHSTKGRYYSLPDFVGNWAQTDDFPKEYTGYSLRDFVLRAGINWQVFENTGEWAESGCGITFREDQFKNHYLIYYSLDGRSRFYRNIGDTSFFRGRSIIYDVDRMNGQGHIMLAVEDAWITVYFNDKLVYQNFDPYLISGELAFTIISGSMMDYGTKCEMTNIELWEIQ